MRRANPPAALSTNALHTRKRCSRGPYEVLLAKPDQHLFVYPLSTNTVACLEDIVQTRGYIVKSEGLHYRDQRISY
jgi:hypothetical protein